MAARRAHYVSVACLIATEGGRTSESGENRFGGAHFEPGLRLDEQGRDEAVLDDGGVSLRPHAEAGLAHVGLEAHGAGELCVAVGQHGDLVADLSLTTPRSHDEGVVHGETGNGVDTLVVT